MPKAANESSMPCARSGPERGACAQRARRVRASAISTTGIRPSLPLIAMALGKNEDLQNGSENRRIQSQIFHDPVNGFRGREKVV